ncbi:DUF5641 domain-containing protein [Trichonephila clavipes]|nr:DUF5641 domain-containing protein [Trichonephila clavipes]
MAAGRIFDPLGFASPFTIRFKILFQEIWQRKTDWDEELLPDIREKFEQWCSEASFLCELQIPRYALQCDSVNCPECEIHTFSDASIKAYGAVSYVRLRTFDKISVHLLASKSRVAPLKVLTLPRLELMGALLAARLAKEVSRVLNEKISTTNYFWTDSTIALSWIQGPSNRWKVFVANRVKEIRSLTDKDSWRHCPGKDNPSDLLTRGISADSLINCEKWWKGPSFLQEGNTVPVSNNVLLSDESAYLEELKPTERKTLTVILDNNLLNHILSVSNNFQKNLCIFSYIYRFINNCKRPSNKQIGPLRMCEIQRAEITLVKLVQQMEFNSEIKDLSCKGMVNPQKRVEWSFIPPRAPNHGGLWEAGVKAVKYHLRRVMGNLRFTYEEFLTILNQIEGVLNSRPLYPLSCDPGDFDALTPGHFLVGRPITAIAEPSLTEVSDNRLKVWQKQTKIVQHIWKRWSNNYLSTLQNRNKWYFEKNNVKIHDMVILKEDNLPVCNWPLGRILEVYHAPTTLESFERFDKVKQVEACLSSAVLNPVAKECRTLKRRSSWTCVLRQFQIGEQILPHPLPF